jgi:hypothetical protein
MSWEYKYDGPAETEIKSMKEGRSSDSVEYISDESGYDVEEHGDQDKLSNFNEPESDHSGESPVLKRGRKRNRPLPAKQKPRPPIQLNLESIREKQETDDILSTTLKLKNESPEKPLWEGICSYGIDIKF